MGWATLDETLTNVARSSSLWPPALTERDPTDTVDWVALAIRAFWAGEFDAVRDAAAHARRAASGAVDHALATGAQALAMSGALEDTGSDPWTAHLADVHPTSQQSTVKHCAFARYLLAESALACARLDIATQIATQTVPPVGTVTPSTVTPSTVTPSTVIPSTPTCSTDAAWHEPWLEHPFSVIMLGARVRIAAFSGRIDDAAALLPELIALGRRHGLDDLASAVAGLVTGNADDVAATRTQIVRLISGEVPARDYVGRGIHLLTAFGAIAIGEVEQAAALVLTAGGDAGLARFTIVDRALGLELLTVAAVAADDADAAHAWCAQAEMLAGSSIAAPTLDRIRARVALFTGDPHAAVRWAQSAAEAARHQGRVVEAAESEMVLARARIAADQVAQAARSLRHTVSAADATGHRAVRRSAAQALALARRRLPPLRGGGWEALSPRESEVAELIVRGEDCSAIAQRLYLSPATVRVHTSRVLAAFGVPTRTALIAAVCLSRPPEGGAATLPHLTSRRAQVVELVAHGSTNAAIAAALGISVKIVERHASQAMSTWHATSRAQLAAMWWTQEPASG